MIFPGLVTVLLRVSWLLARRCCVRMNLLAPSVCFWFTPGSSWDKIYADPKCPAILRSFTQLSDGAFMMQSDGSFIGAF